jgi:hypothetical protein
MPINFDPNSLNSIFDKNFGAGAYNAGLSNAAKAGMLKQQASFAKTDYLKRLKAAQTAATKAAKASTKKTYQDAVDSLNNDSTTLDQIRQQGAYKAAEDIKNDPVKKQAIKDQGYTVQDYIDAMYNATSSGKFRSEREYNQYANQLGKDTKSANKASQNTVSTPTQKTNQQQQQKKSSPSLLSKIGNGLKGIGSEIGAAATAAEQFVNPFDKVSADQAVKNYMNRNQSQGFQEVARGANRAVDSASLGLMSNLDKKVNNRTPYYNSQRAFGQGGGTDMITSGLGFLVPGIGAAKGVKALGLGAKSIPAVEKGAGLMANLARGSQVARTVAKEGALVGGALPLAQMGINYAINPKDQNLKENLMNVALGAGLGAVGDPILRGLGSAGGNVLAKFAKGEVPTYTGKPNQATLDALSPKLQQGLNSFRQTEQQPLKANISNLPLNTNKLLEGIKPFDGYVPKQAKNDVSNSPLFMSLNPAKTAEKMNPTPKLTPVEQQYQNEFNNAVQQQVAYLKNSMGKGVDHGTTSNGQPGNFKEVTGTYNVSNNPKWYQDFYKANGRKPNNAELQQLAKEHVLNGFQDEYGNIPSFVPKKIQDINDQIDQAMTIIKQQPEQAPVLKPYLDALSQEKTTAEEEYKQFLMKTNLQMFGKNEPKATNISPKSVNSDPTAPNPVDGHGYGLALANEKPKEPKISPVLQDAQKQTQGNADTFRGKISDQPVKEKKNINDNLRTQFVDATYPGYKYEKKIAGNISSAEDSLYKSMRLFKGSPEKAHLIVKQQLEPIFNEMDKNNINLKDLRDYALAVHAKDVNEKGINSGFTNAEIKDVIDKLGSPEMEALRKKVVGVNDYAMKLLSSGEKPVLDPALVQYLKKKWPNYLSLFRDMADNKVEFTNGVGKSMVNATSPLKTLLGSERNTIDPMESLVKNLFKAVNASDRNEVSAQVAKLAAKDTEGAFIRPVDKGEDTSRLNVIHVMNKGKKEYYEVPPDLYKSLKDLDQESTNTLVKLLQKPASMLRAGATLTPEFSLRNPMRDVANAFVTSQSGYNPFTDFPVGLWQAIWKGRSIKIGNKEFKTAGDLYQQFIKENGGYGNIISMDRNMHQKLLKQALNDHNLDYVDVTNIKTYKALLTKYKNPLNALRKISDISETATKVGEFRAAIRSGATPKEAAYRARDLMDFARAGSSVREANKVVAFLNANIQGKSKLIRAIKENPVKFTSKALVAVTLPTIGEIVAQNTYANDKQKQIISDAPQWLRDTFYLVPIPGTNQIARIPKPFDLAFPFSNVVERAFDFVAKHDQHAFDGFVKNAISSAAIPVMLTGLAPFVEGMTNYSFFKQGPIIPSREANINYPDQYDVNTSEVAKVIGKGINQVTGGTGVMKNFGSPRVIDNTIQGLFGGTGTYATNTIDGILNKTGAVNNPDRPAKSIDQKPLARAFLVNQSSTGNSMDMLYNIKEKLTRSRGSAKEQNQTFTQETQYQMANQATKNIGKISSQIRTIQNSPQMTAEQKKMLLDQLIQQRNNIALQTMQKLNQMR